MANYSDSPVFNALGALTDSQLIAMKQLHEFLDTQHNCFLLKGYAGTGKTYLISRLTEYLEMKDIPYVLAAPTGRAARMLSQKTNQDASTIHSLIYAGADELLASVHEPEQTVLTFTMKKFQHPSETVFIIDEASMIADSGGNGEFLNFGSGRLLCDFLNHISLNYKETGKRSKRRVIFVGDPAQLPPVNQPSSPALSAEYLKQQFHLDSFETQLTEVVRQEEESTVLAFATALRDALMGESFLFPPYRVTPNTRVVKKEQFIALWQEVATKNLDEVAVITYSNELALAYNRSVRKLLFRTRDDAPRKGDRILVINNNQYYNFLNGDILEIKQLLSERETLYAKNPFSDEEYPLHFRDVLVQWRDAAGDMHEKEVKLLENMMTSKKGSLTREEYAALRALSLSKAGLSYPKSRGKKKNSRALEEFKKKSDEALRESEFLHALQVKFGYALTCHKAQGGEWKNVFIDFQSFGPRNSESYLRWAYTAVTRAKETLFAINPPVVEQAAGGPNEIRYVGLDE